MSTWDAAQALVDVDRAVIAMERRGFSIDAEFCTAKADEADRDEVTSLARMAELSRALGVETDDSVWSSPQKQAVVFHDNLRWPRSPVWKKGKVKPGETKLDGTALDWISGRVPESRALLKELVHLKRVRLCGDWLRKLPSYVAPDGRVHPVCGPAGDDDDRYGAKTGRLGIKNPSSNFPKDDETENTKDLYGVRRAIVAAPGNAIVGRDYEALEVFIQADHFIDLFDDWVLAEKVAPGAPDIHSVTAREIFGVQLGQSLPDGTPVATLDIAEFKNPANPDAKGKRQATKEVRYGRSYGKTVWGFAISLKDNEGNAIGEKRAQAVLDAFLRAEPAQAQWEEWCRAFVMRNKMMISYGGRVLPFHEEVESGDEWRINRAVRRAMNVPQSDGADIIGLAMVILEREGRLAALGYGMILQLHDAIVAEGPEERAEEASAVIGEAMERAGARWLRLKLRTSGGFGRSFADC